MTAKTPEVKEVAVKKVVVQLGKKELVLDIEDAKQLKDVLNELFGQVVVEKVAPAVEKTVIQEHHYHKEYTPYWYWNQPAITYCAPNTGAGSLQGILCNTTSNGSTYSLDTTNGSISCSYKPNGGDELGGAVRAK